jgi:hypothetical protein
MTYEHLILILIYLSIWVFSLIDIKSGDPCVFSELWPAIHFVILLMIIGIGLIHVIINLWATPI